MSGLMGATPLGNALQALGELESGRARLEQAVVAYQAALEERTRERVLVDWAHTHNNLGNALRALSRSEADTARCEQAVAAYRAALSAWPLEQEPLKWAATMGNIAIVERDWGEKASEASHFHVALAACDAALEVFRRIGPASGRNQAIQLCATIVSKLAPKP